MISNKARRAKSEAISLGICLGRSASRRFSFLRSTYPPLCSDSVQSTALRDSLSNSIERAWRVEGLNLLLLNAGLQDVQDVPRVGISTTAAAVLLLRRSASVLLRLSVLLLRRLPILAWLGLAILSLPTLLGVLRSLAI